MSIIAALEHIDRQNDDFGEQIEKLVNLIQGEIDNHPEQNPNLDGSPYVKKLETLIYRRLGLSVTIYTNKNLAAILPFYSNRNHIFLSEQFRGLNIIEQTKFLAESVGKKGTVNLKTAYVTGIFSEYKHPLFLNFILLSKKYNLNAGEITAAILHELGHGFDACYYSDRTDRTNQVLLTVMQRVMDRRGPEDLEYVYKELEKITPSVKKETVDRFLNGSKVIAGMAWFDIVVNTVRSQLQNDKYNETSFEQLADSFASRFGYGKYLITGLSKLHENSIETSSGLLTFAYLLEISAIAATSGLIFLFLAAPATFAAGLLLAAHSLFITYLSGEGMKDYTYDNLKDRYLRIRQDAIDQLKDLSLKKNDIQGILDSIYALDNVVKDVKEYKSLISRISNFIFTTNRNAVNSVEAQKLMEALASNDLFISAAELKSQS